MGVQEEGIWMEEEFVYGRIYDSYLYKINQKNIKLKLYTKMKYFRYNKYLKRTISLLFIYFKKLELNLIINDCLKNSLFFIREELLK